jgi:hypothetical protein
MDHGPGAGRTRCGAMANGQSGRHGPTYQRRLASIHGRSWPDGDRSMGRRMCAMEGKADLLLWRS